MACLLLICLNTALKNILNSEISLFLRCYAVIQFTVQCSLSRLRESSFGEYYLIVLVNLNSI